MKVTTLPGGAQAAYIKINDGVLVGWVQNEAILAFTTNPALAQMFTPNVALMVYNNLASVGYKGLSITNAIPSDADRPVCIHAWSDDDVDGRQHCRHCGLRSSGSGQ